MSDSPTSMTNIWGDRLFAILTILIGVSFVSILILGSYYDQPITQALSFDIRDGQCDPATQGVGVHCFGDFQDIRKQLELPNVWDGTRNSYPPTGLLPNLMVKPIESLFGVRVSLFVFIALLFLAVATPAIFFVSKATREQSTFMKFGCLSIFSQPLIFALDRGNGNGFVVPLITLYAIKLNRHPNWYATLAIAGAASIRPQFALLTISLLAFGQVKHFLIASFATLAMVFVPFMFWSGNRRTNLAMWFRNITSYSNDAKTDVADKYPVNLSMRSVADHLDIMLDNSISNWVQVNFVTISVVLLGVIACSLFACRNTNTKSMVLIVSLSLPCLLPETSFGYYSLFTLVLAALIFADSNFFETPNRHRINQMTTRSDLMYRWLIVSVIALSLAPLPFVYEVGRNSISLEYFGTVWSVVLVASLAKLIIQNRVPSR